MENEPRRETEPRYGVRLSDEERAARAQRYSAEDQDGRSAGQGDGPSLHSTAYNAGGTPYGHAPQSGWGPYPTPMQPAAHQWVPAVKLPSRKGPWLSIIVSFIVMIMIPVVIFALIVSTLSGTADESDSVGGLRKVYNNTTVDIVPARPTWLISTGDESTDCMLVLADGTHVEAKSDNVISAGRVIFSFPPQQVNSATLSCDNVTANEPFIMGEGDVGEWIHSLMTWMVAGIIIGFLAFCVFVGGIIWLIVVSSKRRRIMRDMYRPYGV